MANDGVEILARTNNKVKPTHGNETMNQNSLAVVWNKYRTGATHPIRAPLRGTKQIQLLHKKQPLRIQNMNVPSSAMHITDMMNKNGASKICEDTGKLHQRCCSWYHRGHPTCLRFAVSPTVVALLTTERRDAALFRSHRASLVAIDVAWSARRSRDVLGFCRPTTVAALLTTERVRRVVSKLRGHQTSVLGRSSLVFTRQHRN